MKTQDLLYVSDHFQHFHYGGLLNGVFHIEEYPVDRLERLVRFIIVGSFYYSEEIR